MLGNGSSRGRGPLARGANGEGGGDHELGENDGGDLVYNQVGEGKFVPPGVEREQRAYPGGQRPELKENEQAEADDEGGQDDGYIEDGVDEIAAGEADAGEEVAYGDGDPEGENGGDGAGDHAQGDGVADFGFAECFEDGVVLGEPCEEVAAFGVGPEHVGDIANEEEQDEQYVSAADDGQQSVKHGIGDGDHNGRAPVLSLPSQGVGHHYHWGPPTFSESSKRKLKPADSNCSWASVTRRKRRRPRNLWSLDLATAKGWTALAYWESM